MLVEATVRPMAVGTVKYSTQAMPLDDSSRRLAVGCPRPPNRGSTGARAELASVAWAGTGTGAKSDAAAVAADESRARRWKETADMVALESIVGAMVAKLLMLEMNEARSVA